MLIYSLFKSQMPIALLLESVQKYKKIWIRLSLQIKKYTESNLEVL